MLHDIDNTGAMSSLTTHANRGSDGHETTPVAAPENQETPPKVGSSDGSPPPKPPKVPLVEFRKKRQQIQMRIKVLETYVVEAMSQNGNPYEQLVVEYLLLSTMEKKAKRTAAYTEEAEIIFEADLQPGPIYIVTLKKSIDGWWIWEGIQPAK